MGLEERTIEHFKKYDALVAENKQLKSLLAKYNRNLRTWKNKCRKNGLFAKRQTKRIRSLIPLLRDLKHEHWNQAGWMNHIEQLTKIIEEVSGNNESNRKQKIQTCATKDDSKFAATNSISQP